MNFFKNLINFSKIKSFLIILGLLCIYIFISAISYVSAVSDDISNSVFRLHVIANSDSTEDQALKLKVRDELISYMNSICKNCNSKQEAIGIAYKHEDDFKKIAKKVIEDNGFSYDVNIQIGKSDFPTKQYGDISFPSGTYDALKVKIGKAEGQNWWCVMFPPLCFVDVSSGIVPDSSKQEIKENLNGEEYNLISDSVNGDFSFKFKLVELFQNLKLGLK